MSTGMVEVDDPWARERCGVYAWAPRLTWAGPYHDAAVLDQVASCWLSAMGTWLFVESLELARQIAWADT